MLPKTEPKVAKTIKFRAEMWDWLHTEAERQHRPLTNLLEVIVIEAMDRGQD